MRRYDMFKRVEAFGRDYLADLAPNSEGAKHLTALQEARAGLDKAKAQQAQPRATVVEVLFDALQLDLKGIARTARAIEQDDPGFADSFVISGYNPASLLTSADRFLEALEPKGVAERFIAHEMEKTFVTDLEADLQAIDDAHQALHSGSATAVSKTKALGLGVRAGIKAVNYLDAIVNNKFKRDAETLRAWQTASHIERLPHREKSAAPSTGSTPATSTVATPAGA